MNTRQPSSIQSRVFSGVLWTLQILWGLFFSFTGFGKVLAYDPAIWHRMLHQVAWFSAVPQGLFVFIGVCEGLGGAALIIPAITRVAPKLVPIAAAGLAVIMLLAVGFHIARGEAAFFVPLNLVLGAVAAFIAYGRSTVPIQSAPARTLRVVSGLAVFVALVFAGFAPVWYQSTHIH
jgi:hypothetical protein